MKKIFSYTVIAISLLSYSNIFANQCPSANSIKTLGLNHIQDASTDFAKRVSYEPYSTYDTNQKWNFFMICSCPWSGKCEDEKILSAAKKTLEALRFENMSDGWRCEYSSNSGNCRS